MNILEIIFLAIALSIDAFVVSFSHGLIFRKNKFKNSMLLASFFGFFQFLMPVLGYYCALGVYKYLEKVDNCIVFLIFLILGIKFIKEAFDEDKQTVCCIALSCVFMFAVATSIDAFGAGISLCFRDVSIWFPAVLIGVITFINSLIGFFATVLFKKFPSRYLEIMGGLILIGLGIKALL